MFALILLGIPSILFVQLLLAPTVIGLLKTQNKSAGWALMLLIPYVGVAFAYRLVALSQEKQ